MVMKRKTRGSATSGRSDGSTRSGLSSAFSGLGKLYETGGISSRNPHSTGGISVGDVQRDVDLSGLSQSGGYLDNFLAQLGRSTGQSDSFLRLLLDIASGNTDRPGTIDDDLQQKLIEMYLSQMTRQEQRQYDENALQEQRLYDNPQNQLARLMGAGISRDAAIQMLQGTGESPLVGSGAESGVAPFQNTPSQQVMQAVSTAAGLLGTIGNLVGLGFTIPQAIQQTHYLRNANFLTDQQNKAYKSAGQAYSILSAAGAAAESFDSVGSAVKAVQSLAANGNEMAAQFVASGGIADMQGNAPFASNVLRDLYKSENGSEMFRKEMKRADLQNELTNAQVETEYQKVMESLYHILMYDEQAKLYREQLRTQKAISRQEEYAADFADFQGNVLKGLRNLTDNNGNDIVDLMSASQFNEVWMQFKESAARCQDPAKFQKWCDDNWSAVCDLATIQQIANSNYKLNFGDEDAGSEDKVSWTSAILRFARLLNDSGVGAQISNAVRTGTEVFNSANNILNPRPRVK